MKSLKFPKTATNQKPNPPGYCILATPGWGEKTRQLTDFVYNNPGYMVREIVRDTKLSYGTVHGTLDRLLKQGKLKRRFQDERWRYYAPNYRFGDEIKDSQITYPPVTKAAPKPQKPEVAPPQFATQVESAAKDFFWQQQSDSLREFVKWVKEQS